MNIKDKVVSNDCNVTVKEQYLVNKVVGVTADCAPIEQPFLIFNSKEMLENWWESLDEDHKIQHVFIYRFIDGKNPRLYTIRTKKEN